MNNITTYHDKSTHKANSFLLDQKISEFFTNREIFRAFKLVLNSAARLKKRKKDRVYNSMKVMSVILKFYNYETGKVGMRKDGKFIDLCDYEYLAKETKLSHRTVVSIMSDFKKCGLIKVTQAKARVDETGKVIYPVATKEVTLKTFRILGISANHLAKMKNWAGKVFKKVMKTTGVDLIVRSVTSSIITPTAQRLPDLEYSQVKQTQTAQHLEQKMQDQKLAGSKDTLDYLKNMFRIK